MLRELLYGIIALVVIIGLATGGFFLIVHYGGSSMQKINPPSYLQ